MDSSLNEMKTDELLAGRRGNGIGVTGAAQHPLYKNLGEIHSEILFLDKVFWLCGNAYSVG
jgi:hypothetical protein